MCFGAAQVGQALEQEFEIEWPESRSHNQLLEEPAFDGFNLITTPVRDPLDRVVSVASIQTVPDCNALSRLFMQPILCCFSGLRIPDLGFYLRRSNICWRHPMRDRLWVRGGESNTIWNSRSLRFQDEIRTASSLSSPHCWAMEWTTRELMGVLHPNARPRLRRVGRS